MLKEISVEIIRKCPNNCLYCSSNSNLKRSEKLPYYEFVKIVNDAKELGAKTICLSGGEPFLHDNIIEMTKFVSDSGLDCYIYTSGIVVDENMSPTSIPEEKMKKISAYASKLIFNIEGSNSKTYDKIMGTKNCFEKMKHSVLLANKFNIVTEAHFVPMKINYLEIDKVIEMCMKLNVSKISFLRLVLHGRADENKEKIALSNDELNDLRIQLSKLEKRNNDISIRIGVPLLKDGGCAKCEAADGKLNIKYDGKVYPCEVFKNKKFENILKYGKPESIYNKTLKEIYLNSNYLKSVRNYSKEFQKNMSCETCIGQYMMNFKKEK